MANKHKNRKWYKIVDGVAIVDATFTAPAPTGFPPKDHVRANSESDALIKFRMRPPQPEPAIDSQEQKAV